MKCLINAASDVQNIAFAGLGLTLKVVSFPTSQLDDGSWSMPYWTVKMKYPRISGSAHVMIRMEEGKYLIRAVKRNHFPNDLFKNVFNMLLGEANEVGADTEPSTLPSS